MAFFVIGAGVGGVIIRNRQVCPGAHRYGGEFGMMPLNLLHIIEDMDKQIHKMKRHKKKLPRYSGKKLK